MSCISPCAPAGETARGLKFDSVRVSPYTSAGSMIKPPAGRSCGTANCSSSCGVPSASRTSSVSWAAKSVSCASAATTRQRPAERPAVGDLRPQRAQLRLGARALPRLQQREGAHPARDRRQRVEVGRRLRLAPEDRPGSPTQNAACDQPVEGAAIRCRSPQPFEVGRQITTAQGGARGPEGAFRAGADADERCLAARVNQASAGPICPSRQPASPAANAAAPGRSPAGCFPPGNFGFQQSRLVPVWPRTAPGRSRRAATPPRACRRPPGARHRRNRLPPPCRAPPAPARDRTGVWCRRLPPVDRLGACRAPASSVRCRRASPSRAAAGEPARRGSRRHRLRHRSRGASRAAPPMSRGETARGGGRPGSPRAAGRFEVPLRSGSPPIRHRKPARRRHAGPAWRRPE